MLKTGLPGSSTAASGSGDQDGGGNDNAPTGLSASALAPELEGAAGGEASTQTIGVDAGGKFSSALAQEQLL